MGEAEAPVYLRVRDLVVDYEVFEGRRAALRERLLGQRRSSPHVVHAVRGVSFEVRAGERVGIIGSNGSGKSTLLAALAGLLPVKRGKVEVVEAPKLLGVGAALVPASSGWRNARLGSFALGVPRRDIDAHVQRVAEFAELGEAMGRPLRTYSSGQRARLLFSIATSVSPKILLVDEALSVGDRSFRKKSSDRIAELVDNSGVFILVNHSPGELKNHCERGIWIDEGLIRADGPIKDVIAAYQAS